MSEVEIKLNALVAKFREWLEENYSKEQIEALLTDDPGYPEWDEIESYFSELLEKDRLSTLSVEGQKNLLYLIARNWDIGGMIGWLYEDSPLSNLGTLKSADFIMLAQTLSGLNHPEFDDAKSQFVSSFKKFPELTPEIETLLLKFYSEENEYTKRHALMTLGRLGYPEIRNLLELSWNTVDDEHHKMGCLVVIHWDLKDVALMKTYLSLAEKCEGEYLSKYVAKLKENPLYK